MKKLYVPFVVLAVVFIGVTYRAAADQPAAKPVDTTATSYDMKAQSLYDLDDLHKKFVSLAQATPAEKFAWRPADGVRSIAEVYLHVAGTNFGFATILGTMPAPDYTAKGYEQSTTDKDKIIAELNRSFDYAHAAIEKMANSDFKKPMPKYGADANAGDFVYLIMTHTHEHFGQSIAYARMNGIVPPWTAEQMKKQQEQQQSQKPQD